MPIDLEIIHASEFVRLTPRKVIDFEATKEALQTLARACCKRGVGRALLDLRPLPIPARPVFSPVELAALVETFREAGFAQYQRLAVLYRSDPHHGVRMFAFISKLRGLQVRAFDEFEAALVWLSEKEERPSEQGEHEIPIRFARRTVKVTRTSTRLARKRARDPRCN